MLKANDVTRSSSRKKQGKKGSILDFARNVTSNADAAQKKGSASRWRRSFSRGEAF